MPSNATIASALASFAGSFLPDSGAFGDVDAGHISRIKTLTQEITSTTSPLHIASLSEAKRYYVALRHSESSNPAVDLLSKKTVDTLRLIFDEVIALLGQTRDERIFEIMYGFTHAIWPLYSRSSSTQDMGFDLQEHVDIFASATEDERSRLRDDLLARYGIRD